MGPTFSSQTRSQHARGIHYPSEVWWYARHVNDTGRNDPCPCGSGSKYKRCCLNARDAAERDRLECEKMWARMQRWAFDRFEQELGPALVEHLRSRGVGSAANPANDDDMSLALGWLLIDRRLACGDTPARLYAGLPELPARERWLAERVAGSCLGVHRVIDAEPRAWMELEDVLTGTRSRVDSPNVSEIAVRWHVLICRVERGGPVPVLWGGAAFYEPNDEVEILAELRRIAEANRLGTDAAGLAAALDASARDMTCFVPPSRLAERTIHTLEGDPVTLGEATWRLRDRAAALRTLCDMSELALRPRDNDRDDYIFDWLTSRRDVLALRPVLPPNAVVIEDGLVALDERGEFQDSDITSFGTFTVRGKVLEFSCLSAQRLERAVALVERSLGPLATEPERGLRSIEEAREEPDDGPAGERAETTSRERRVGSADAPDERVQLLYYRLWIDDPNPHLGGLSPREAAGRPEHREQLERQLRILEHRNALNRNDPHPGPEVAWLRGELALDCEPVTL